MFGTGVSAFDAAIHESNLWLKEFCQELGWPNQEREDALVALVAVLQAVRDRLPLDEAVALGDRLPALLRGFYFREWNASHDDGPANRDAFLQRVYERMARPAPVTDPEKASRATFRVLERHLGISEVEEVRDDLPNDVREMWPQRRA